MPIRPASSSTTGMQPNVKKEWLRLMRSGIPQTRISMCVIGGVGSPYGSVDAYDAQGLLGKALGIHRRLLEGRYHLPTLAAELKIKLPVSDEIIDQVIMMNDKESKSFEEIAAWVEARL